MAEIDASIIGKLQPPQFNPLDVISKATALGSGVLQNRLVNQQIGGKEALGRAVTSATDPVSGKTNFEQAQGLLAQDPQGAFAMPEFAGQVLDRSLKELQIKAQQLGITGDQGKFLSAGMLPFIQEFTRKDKDGNTKTATKADFTKAVANVIEAMGPSADETVLRRAVSLVQSASDDPQQLLQTARGLAILGNPTAETITQLNGTPTNVDAGSTIVNQQVSPLTGEASINGGITKERTPSEKAGMVQVYDPATKTMKYVTSGSLVGDAAPGAARGHVGQVGPALGEAQTAEANVEQAQALQKRASIVPQRRAALQNTVDTLADFTPGPKADLTYALGSLATQFGLNAPKVAKGVAAQEEFNKLAAQISLDQWGALGGSGSNEQLATAMKANPHASMSKMGIKNVVALLQGNEDAIDAQYSAWKKYSKANGDSSYGDFLEGWNRYYNPRVFQAEHMTASAVKEMVAKMSPDERKTYARDKNIAQQAGWIQ